MAAASRESDLIHDIYGLLTGDEDARVCPDIPESACREQPRNFLIRVVLLIASKTGGRNPCARGVVADRRRGRVTSPKSAISGISRELVRGHIDRRTQS